MNTQALHQSKWNKLPAFCIYNLTFYKLWVEDVKFTSELLQINTKKIIFLIVAFRLKMRNYIEQISLMMRLQFPGVFIFLFFPSNVFLRCFFPMYFSDVFLKWWDCSFLAFSFLCYSAASPPMYFQFDLTRRESHRLKFQTTKFPQEICFPPKATRLSLDLTGSKLKGCVYWPGMGWERTQMRRSYVWDTFSEMETSQIRIILLIFRM